MLFAFDGTWDRDLPGSDLDTNVVKFCDAYDGPLHYEEGIGASLDPFGKIVSGATGYGGRGKVRAALRELARKPGDAPVDVVGFSRGAALALDFANRATEAGIAVRFLGLFDTVPSFWLPWVAWDPGWKLDAPRGSRCFHAMALDERRNDFKLRRQKAGYAEEVWFAGVHGDVGGGFGDSRAPFALDWMFRKAAGEGVPLVAEAVLDNRARMNPNAPVGSVSPAWLRTARRKPAKGDRVHCSAMPFHSGATGVPVIVLDETGAPSRWASV